MVLPSTPFSSQHEIDFGFKLILRGPGWPHGETKDTDPVFEQEKELADSFPIGKTDVAIIEHAKARGVTSFIVIASTVYGKGTGEWNKVSVVLPSYVKGSISQKKVHKFAENTKVSGMHISDLTALHGLVVEKILRQEALPSGTGGYYFAPAHDLIWCLDRLAATLHSRGLVTETQTPIWPSDEVAGEALGVPVDFVQALRNSGENVTSENTRRVRWSSGWDKDRFIRNMDDEIDAVLELGQAKSSLIGSLFKAAQG